MIPPVFGLDGLGLAGFCASPSRISIKIKKFMKLNLILNIQKEVPGSTKNDGSGNSMFIEKLQRLIESEVYGLGRYSDAQGQFPLTEMNGPNYTAVWQNQFFGSISGNY